MECSHVQSSCCNVSHYVFMHTACYAPVWHVHCEGREMIYFHTDNVDTMYTHIRLLNYHYLSDVTGFNGTRCTQYSSILICIYS